MEIKFKYQYMFGPKFNYTLNEIYWKINVPIKRSSTRFNLL